MSNPISTDESPTIHSTEPTPTTTPVETLALCPSGSLPCCVCGIATSPEPSINVEVPVWTDHPVKGPIFHRVLDVQMSTCDDCQSLYTRAEVLADAHPILIGRVGRMSAIQHAAHVLIGCAISGVTEPATDVPDSEFATMIRELGALATSATWEQLMTPQRNGYVAASPWSAVPSDNLSELHQAQASVLAEKVARHRPAVQLAPPPADLGGCLLCGVAKVEMSAVEVYRAGGPDNASASVWTPRGADGLKGHLCPECAEAVERVGGIGPTATEAALVRHLGLWGGWIPGEHSLDNLRPWHAVAKSARAKGREIEPSATPWAHAGDLDKLRANIGLYLGVDA